MTQSQLSESSRWIWPFELLERIGEGGMGVVYRARYVVKDHEVALKMLPEDVKDGTTLARFEREMEVLKGLKHPNIVRTFGGVSEDKQRFYAMELLPGGSLEDELHEKKRLSWEAVIEYSLQMCSALSYLHSKGVVHRDVKPSNFMIATDGRIKLSDFGLASVVATRRITAAGRTAGTFLYMAPEQIRGESITPRTDLYALGCVLYELLTGQPPYIGETPAATLHMHCKNPVPRVTELALDCPPALERIVTKLLSKEPEDRYSAAAVVAKELRGVSQAVEVIEPISTGMRGGNHPVTVPPKVSAPTPASGFEARTEVIAATGRERPLWRDRLELAMPVIAVGLLIWALASQFGGSNDQKAHELWRQAATNQQVDVRIQAVNALGELAGEDNIQVVVDRLKSDSEPEVRAAAATALGQAGDAAVDHLPALIKIQKSDPEQRVRIAAAEAVKRLKK